MSNERSDLCVCTNCKFKSFHDKKCPAKYGEILRDPITKDIILCPKCKV